MKLIKIDVAERYLWEQNLFGLILSKNHFVQFLSKKCLKYFRYAKDNHKYDEPLSVKIDDSSNILEVDQPSTSSGLGPSPVEGATGSSPPQVIIYSVPYEY